jgi:nucleoside-diphosphate-sugar epimerase
MTPGQTPGPLILVTGATGYVGGRLVKLLKEHGHHASVACCPDWRGRAIKIVYED